jgi:hypothetical protein
VWLSNCTVSNLIFRLSHLPEFDTRPAQANQQDQDSSSLRSTVTRPFLFS